MYLGELVGNEFYIAAVSIEILQILGVASSVAYIQTIWNICSIKTKISQEEPPTDSVKSQSNPTDLRLWLNPISVATFLNLNTDDNDIPATMLLLLLIIAGIETKPGQDNGLIVLRSL